MNTTIIGLGLIGGSIGLELKRSGLASQRVGVDANPEHATEAVRLGLVDKVKSLEEALPDAELVIVSIPVGAVSGMLPTILDQTGSKTTVVEMGSTKKLICKSVVNHPERSRFVAAHPIAGTENSGPTAALMGLFKDKTNIVCEKEKSSGEALAVAGKVFEAMGMRTIFMEPEEHDKHVAYVSHLSHVSSFLLGQTVLDIEKSERNIFNLAGSGFASTVRLAKSSPHMWGPIFEQNAEYLSSALMEYIMHLQKFHYHLMRGDTQALMEILTKANDIRRVLGQPEK